MGMIYLVNLEGGGCKKIYKCKHCQTHLALSEHIVSKSFHCKHGKAYLFAQVVNVSLGEKEERLMMTGMHTVADIFCVSCGSIVGWKYVCALKRTWLVHLPVHFLHVLFDCRKLLMIRARSTRKENSSSRGLRSLVQMEPIIGLVTRRKLVEVMQMMSDFICNLDVPLAFLICTFFPISLFLAFNI